MNVKIVGGDYEYTSDLYVTESVFTTDTGLTLDTIEILELNSRYEVEVENQRTITGATIGRKVIKQIFTLVLPSKKINETLTNFDINNLVVSRFIYISPINYTWGQAGESAVTTNGNVFPCVLKSLKVSDGFSKQVIIELESYLAI